MTEWRLDPGWRAQAVSIAVAYGVSFYDTAYHATALAGSGVFVTADERYVRRALQAGSVVALREWRARGEGR